MQIVSLMMLYAFFIVVNALTMLFAVVLIAICHFG